MKKYLVLICLSVVAASAQNLPTELMDRYTSVKTNIVNAANAMPEENYGFAPVPEEMTFGKWVAHVADAQTGMCSRANGTPVQATAAQKTSKADLIAALRASFDECDKAYAAMTNANASETVGTGRGAGSRISTLWYNVAHDNECYGSMAVYLRIKGVVPPSTAARAAGRGAPAPVPPAKN